MSKQKKSRKVNFGAADSHVKTSRLRTKGSAKVSSAKEVVSSTSSRGSSTTSRKRSALVGCLWKMFPDCSTLAVEPISTTSSKPWMNSGMAFHGECWTQNTSEHPNAVVECTLSQVVETSAPLKYFLNKEQLKSLLIRDNVKIKRMAKLRKKNPGRKIQDVSMPKKLRKCIEDQISLLSNMPELDAFLRQAPKAKDSETMEKLIHATPGAAQMLFVRRMLPSEYERLQGFPRNWTRTVGGHSETQSASQSSNGSGNE